MTAQDQQSRAEFEESYRARNDGSRLYCESEWRGWQAARALPATSSVSNAGSGSLSAGLEPVAEVLSSRPGNDTSTIDKAFPAGTNLFTAAQVQAMGRVPACPVPCGWDALHKIAVGDGAYLTRIDWPEDEEGVSVQRAVVMRTVTNLIDVCRAMLATAPRPPAAQERCPNCDDTGDVHGLDGEWRGSCHCKAAQEAIGIQISKEIQQVAAQERKPLTDERVGKIIEVFSCGDGRGHDVHGIARAVEAAHGIKDAP